MKQPKVVITLDGGIVEDILSDVPSDVIVIDYDVEGIEEDRLTQIPQIRAASTEPAYTVEQVADVMPKRVAELFRIVREEHK